MIELSKRQEEVCEYVSQGLTDKEISELMGVTVTAVKLYIVNARKKFGVGNRTALAIKYLEAKGKLKK